MAINLSAYAPPASMQPQSVNTTPSFSSIPTQFPNPNSFGPVAAINSTPASRAGTVPTSSTLVVGQPTDQSGAGDIAAAFTAANQTASVGASVGVSVNPAAAADCLCSAFAGISGPAAALLGTISAAASLTAKRAADLAGDAILDVNASLSALAPNAAALSELAGVSAKVDLAACPGAASVVAAIGGQFAAAKNLVLKAGLSAQLEANFNAAVAAQGPSCGAAVAAGVGALLG